MRCIAIGWLAIALLAPIAHAWDDHGAGTKPFLVREVPSDPVVATYTTPTLRDQRTQVTVLGNRDDSREATYVLEGRGTEIGAGRKSGRYCEPGCERTGNPRCISVLARSSTDTKHAIGVVGGGTPFRYWGQGRMLNEGTIGMDYSGWLFHRKTWLLWSHGGLHQGGAGRYEAEGPRIVPEK
jgi:hypothetical protein